MSTIATLAPAAFEVLWERMGLGPLPYPFDLAPQGATLDERARLVSAVLADLERTGLVRRGRPEPELEDALRLVAAPRWRVVLMGAPDLAKGGLLRAAASVNGGFAVLLTQTEDALRLDLLRDRSPVAAAVSALPDRRPGPGRPVTVPAAALDAPARPTGGLQRVGAGNGSEDVRQLQAMLAGPFLGTGHVTVEAEGAPPPVTWIDTPAGRYLATGTDWMSVAPGDNRALVQRLSRPATG
ncbi:MULTISPECIES: ESX secretion-associated protein EspG [Actinosynnema]|uniref:ESX secretion-associated protein EspG n=1 Tax=Actinosynnema TaxID=40566 RepID=UPI0020A601F8|nr:ESX secretion-associated protein EspG [Actinosynnema pretiosum]MCP2099257.1 EspG family protein [Actinosynnema pretiosum]